MRTFRTIFVRIRPNSYFRERLNAQEKRMLKQYTRLRRADGKYILYLRVDHQAFHMGEGTLSEQAWRGCCLAIALARLVKHEKE